MRGKGWKGLAQPRHRFALGRFGLIRVDHAFGHSPRQHPVARRFGPVSGPVGAAAFGALRNGNQQRRLGGRQAIRFLAEIGNRGGPDAFKVAAKGRKMQVKLQDLVLGQPPLQRQRDAHLPQLAADFAGRAFLQQPRDLHCQG